MDRLESAAHEARSGRTLSGGTLSGGTLSGGWSLRWVLPQGFSLVGLVLVIVVGLTAASDGFGYDAHAYWAASEYTTAEATPDAFVYSPPVLLLCRALGLLPWQVFLDGYSVGTAVGVWILAGPLTPFIVFTPPVASEITLANIHVLLALVAVFGLRWPALWSFAILTKVTPGVGVLWFAVRGEWRKLGIALGTTAAFVVPSLFLAPGLWADWFRILGQGSHQDDGGPLLVRLPVAMALVVVGARRDWPWLVPLASMLALPVLWSVHGYSMLLGCLWYAQRWILDRARLGTGSVSPVH